MDTSVGTVSASDPDGSSTSYGTLTYSFLGGMSDEFNTFEMSSGGEMTVINSSALFYPRNFDVTIVATDGGVSVI